MFAAGAVYFIVVLAAGFLLWTLRTLLVAPKVSHVTAVIIEVPIMLVLAWLACGWVFRKIRVAPKIGARAAMGPIALGLLLVTEALLSLGLASPSLKVGSYSQREPLIGLAAQLLYACFPLIRTGATGERLNA